MEELLAVFGKAFDEIDTYRSSRPSAIADLVCCINEVQRTLFLFVLTLT
jgi:hypothetical protein